MAYTFGDVDRLATRVINRLSRETHRVAWTRHSREEMASDDFDDPAVLTCLRRGVAYGPETRKGQTRYNMVHRNLHVRVVVGWSVGLELGALQRLTVITVMRIEE